MKSFIFKVVLASSLSVGLLTTVQQVVRADTRDCTETKRLCYQLGGTRSGDAFCALVPKVCMK